MNPTEQFEISTLKSLGTLGRYHFAFTTSATYMLLCFAIIAGVTLFAMRGNARCEEAGRVVERQAKHMTRLLDDLLDVSRITHGRIVLRPEVLDLRTTTRAAIEALGPLMKEHETPLEIVLGDANAEARWLKGEPVFAGVAIDRDRTSVGIDFDRSHFDIVVGGGHPDCRIST